MNGGVPILKSFQGWEIPEREEKEGNKTTKQNKTKLLKTWVLDNPASISSV
jgi:hypothetical protein